MDKPFWDRRGARVALQPADVTEEMRHLRHVLELLDADVSHNGGVSVELVLDQAVIDDALVSAQADPVGFLPNTHRLPLLLGLIPAVCL